MKLLALRCPHCNAGLAPGQADVVVQCANCHRAVTILEDDIRLIDTRYAAPDRKDPQTWVPFWGFEGAITIQSREAQNTSLSPTGWFSARDSQEFWGRASRFLIPAWNLELKRARELAEDLIKQQPEFRVIERPENAVFLPAVVTPQDARKLLELVVVTIEARRKDWIKEIEFTAEMGPPALWILPAQTGGSDWLLLAENTRS